MRGAKQRLRRSGIWLVLTAVAMVPVAAAMQSPLLQWRDLVYIIAGLAGIFALTLLLFQPLLATGALPDLSARHSKRIHRLIGITLVVLVLIHVAGLWLTSPPDVVDALLFVSPAPFSAWGVIAMWGIFVSATLVSARITPRWKPRYRRIVHRFLAGLIVFSTVIHALLIEGTMEPISKAVLCLAILIAATRIARFDR